MVIGNWWNTTDYQVQASETLRGVKVFDAARISRHENKPFLHNYRVDERDLKVAGNLRRASRFLKSVKYDADAKLDISSYDIVSIAWNMPPDFLSATPGQELKLAANVRTYLRFLVENDTYRNSLRVPRPFAGPRTSLAD